MFLLSLLPSTILSTALNVPHLISDMKQAQAWLVLGWEKTRTSQESSGKNFAQDLENSFSQTWRRWPDWPRRWISIRRLPLFPPTTTYHLPTLPNGRAGPSRSSLLTLPICHLAQNLFPSDCADLLPFPIGKAKPQNKPSPISIIKVSEINPWTSWKSRHLHLFPWFFFNIKKVLPLNAIHNNY